MMMMMMVMMTTMTMMIINNNLQHVNTINIMVIKPLQCTFLYYFCHHKCTYFLSVTELSVLLEVNVQHSLFYY